jgi:hypothetical protein
MALDEDSFDGDANELEALRAEMTGIGTQRLQQGLAEWHEAFDSIGEEQIEAVVADLNPSYDPAEEFRGYRGWAEWVREHLERELASREDAK